MLELWQHGFAGGAPELRYTPGGDAVANFRVGSTERWVDRDTGEERERTTWIGWECWGKSGENLAKYVKKGSQLLIKGTIRNDSWDDPKTGEKRYKDRFIISTWKLLDRRPTEGAGPAESPPGPDIAGAGQDMPPGADPAVTDGSGKATKSGKGSTKKPPH